MCKVLRLEGAWSLRTWARADMAGVQGYKGRVTDGAASGSWGPHDTVTFRRD